MAVIKVKYKKGVVYRNIKKLLITILFVLVIFTPSFRIFPYLSWALSGIGFFLLFDRKFVKNIGFKTKSNMAFLGIIFAFIVFSAIIVPIAHTTYDFSYVSLLLGIVLCILRNYLLIYVVGKETSYDFGIVEKYISYFLNACCIYVLFTILFIVFPQFKSFWLGSVIEPIKISTWAAYEFRYSLNGFAAFASASIFSIAILFSAYLITIDKSINYFHISKFIVMAVGCLFYGRVSFVGIALAVFLLVIQNRDVVKTIKVLLQVILVVIVLLNLLNYLSIVEPKFLTWKNWAFEFINNIFVDKEITTHSVTHMFRDMYFIPEFDTLMLGDGYYTDPMTGRYYKSTDVGYMRVICYSGLIGLIITFSGVIYLFKKTLKITESDKFKKLIALFLVLWLVLEMKGESFHRILIFLYPLYLGTVYERRIRDE